MATNTERLDQHQKDITTVAWQLVRPQETTQAAEGSIASQLARVEDSLKRLQAELTELGKTVARQDERLKAVEKLADHPATLSAHEQRLKALEKGTDRLWQFAPIVLSALALLTAAYVAFLKK